MRAKALKRLIRELEDQANKDYIRHWLNLRDTVGAHRRQAMHHLVSKTLQKKRTG